MLLILGIPVFMATLFRFVLPLAQGYLIDYFDLSDHYDFATLFILTMAPMMSGMVIGFNLLDDRDENILTYMSVTPIRKEGYLLFKVFAPLLAVFVQSFFIVIIFNLGQMNLLRLVPLIILLALETPMYALIMASVASNKVEGLAIGKLMGISVAGPVIACFFTSWWKYFAGIMPTFWIAEAYFAQGVNYWIFLGIGFLVHGCFLVWTMQLFLRRSN
jgi:fluoroquinolone transport system permease protein